MSIRLSMPSKVIAVAIAVFALTAIAPAETVASRVRSVEGVNEYSLPNGLRVLMFADAAKPKTTIVMTYLVGSRHEGPSQRGIAHVLEHLLFRKSKRGIDIRQTLAERGAQHNGTTSVDRTNFVATFPSSSESLEIVLRVEAERMQNFQIDAATLRSELGVVKNELALSENNPLQLLHERSSAVAYVKHEYRRPPIGTDADIAAITPAAVTAFYETYYQPDNAILIVAGDFEEKHALRAVQETLGSIERPKRVLPRCDVVEPNQDGERSVVLRHGGSHPSVLMALYHTPAAAHRDHASIDVLARLLGEKESGRLHAKLIDAGLAVSLSVRQDARYDPGLLRATVTMRQGLKSMEPIRKIFLETLESFWSTPPTDKEVADAKDRMLRDYLLAMGDADQVARLLSEASAAGDWRLLFYSRDGLEGVSAQDVVRVARDYLKATNRTLGELVSEPAPDLPKIEAAPNLTTLLAEYVGKAKPSRTPSAELTPEGIEKRVVRHAFPNGFHLALLPQSSGTGVVRAQLRLRFGDSVSLRGKAAIRNVTAASLLSGTVKRSRQEIQSELRRLGAQISVMGGRNEIIVSLASDERHLDDALRLLKEVLAEPAFPPAEILRIQQQRIAGQQATANNPLEMANIAVNRHLQEWDPADPRCVSTPSELIRELESVTAEQVRAFHHRFYGFGHADLTVIGSFDAGAIRTLAHDLFGSWTSAEPYRPLAYPYRTVTPETISVNTKAASSAVLVMGIATPVGDDHRDYPALLMAAYILGGSPSSLLYRSVRDQQGISYAVRSTFEATPAMGYGRFTTLISCAPEHIDQAEATAVRELQRILGDGFAQTDFQAARTAWLKQRRLSRSDEQMLLNTMAFLQQFDRTLEWDAWLEKQVEALKVEDVTGAYRRYLDPSQLTFVRAGNFVPSVAVVP